MGCGGCGQNSYRVPVKVETNVPEILPDGSIEFKEEPVPDLEGYELSGPMTLKPTGVTCTYRVTGIMLQRDGSYAPLHVCRHNKCEYKNKPVTDSICQGCPLRESLNNEN
jgi:hypothetical protein